MEKRTPTEVPLPPPDPSRNQGCPLDRDFADFVLEELRARRP